MFSYLVYSRDIVVYIRVWKTFPRLLYLDERCVPANDTKGSKLEPTNFPRRWRGSNPGPLAQEASALTTRLSRFLLV